MVVYSDPATYYLLRTTYYLVLLPLLLLLLLLLPPPLPGRGGGRQAVENLARRDNTQAMLTSTSNTNQNNPQNTPAGRRICSTPKGLCEWPVPKRLGEAVSTAARGFETERAR